MIIYCFWYSRSVFPVKHTIVAIVSHHPAHAIQLRLPLEMHCWFLQLLTESRCSLGSANVLWEVLMHWNIPCLHTALCIPHPPCMRVAEGPVYYRKIGNVVLTAASEVGVYATLFHLGEGWAHKKLSQQKLTWIDFLIMRKHNAFFFVIFMPVMWYWGHTFSAEITAQGCP